MAYLSLDPVSAAVYTALNVSALTALAPGGVTDDPAQGTAFPFVLYRVSERDIRGFGGEGLPEVDLRVHCYAKAGTYGAPKTTQIVAAKVVELLRDAALTVTGYTQAGRVVYDETVDIGPDELNGVPVYEVVCMFRLWVEE